MRIARLFAQHRAAGAHQSGLEDLVFAVDHQLVILVDDQLEEIEHVAGVQGRGVGRHQGGQVSGTVAVALAAVNVFGGFMVTQRMLEMFKKKEPKAKQGDKA